MIIRELQSFLSSGTALCHWLTSALLVHLLGELQWKANIYSYTLIISSTSVSSADPPAKFNSFHSIRRSLRSADVWEITTKGLLPRTDSLWFSFTNLTVLFGHLLNEVLTAASDSTPERRSLHGSIFFSPQESERDFGKPFNNLAHTRIRALTRTGGLLSIAAELYLNIFWHMHQQFLSNITSLQIEWGVFFCFFLGQPLCFVHLFRSSNVSKTGLFYTTMPTTAVVLAS